MSYLASADKKSLSLLPKQMFYRFDRFVCATMTTTAAITTQQKNRNETQKKKK